MSSDAPSGSAARDRQWFIVSRWQEYEGEARANLLRTIGIGAFYSIELVNHGVHIGALQLPQVVDDRFHQAVTALAVAWTMVSLATLVCLRRHFFPPAAKFITTACDLVLLTAVLTIADGPQPAGGRLFPDYRGGRAAAQPAIGINGNARLSGGLFVPSRICEVLRDPRTGGDDERAALFATNHARRAVVVGRCARPSNSPRASDGGRFRAAHW